MKPNNALQPKASPCGLGFPRSLRSLGSAVRGRRVARTVKPLRFGSVPVMVLAVLLTGCASEAVEGPNLSPSLRVAEIVVIPLEAKLGSTVRVTDRVTIDRAVKMFTFGEWWKNSKRLVPDYRIDLNDDEGKVTTYWIGTFSSLSEFPCYQFCSGFWAAASNTDGVLISDRLKPLASSVAMFEVMNLLTRKGSKPK